MSKRIKQKRGHSQKIRAAHCSHENTHENTSNSYLTEQSNRPENNKSRNNKDQTATDTSISRALVGSDGLWFREEKSNCILRHDRVPLESHARINSCSVIDPVDFEKVSEEIMLLSSNKCAFFEQIT